MNTHRFQAASLSALLLAGLTWRCGNNALQAALETTQDNNSASSYTTSVSTLNITAGVTIDVPLTNGLGIAVADVPVTVHSENGTLYATRWAGTPTKILVDNQTGGATIAGEGNNLIVVYVSIVNNDIRAKESSDGGLTWGTAVSFGAKPTGPALPTACLFRVGGVLNRVVGWSHQPSSTQGPLVIVRHNGTSWGSANSNTVDSSGAVLYCANDQDPEVVWRDHRAGNTGLNPRLYKATINSSSALVSEQLIRNPGNDPSFCGQGSYRFVGAHTGLNDAHLLRSTDGGATYSEVDTESAYSGAQLDDQGKFVSVACKDGMVAASWGDWPTKTDADTYAPARSSALSFQRTGAVPLLCSGRRAKIPSRVPQQLPSLAVWRTSCGRRPTRSNWLVFSRACYSIRFAQCRTSRAARASVL